MEKKEFLKEIHICRRKMNRALLLRILVFALCVGAGVGILFQLIALLTPFYYVNYYSAAAVLLAILVAFVAAYMKRCTMKQAALTMDSFGFQERIVTAYEHLEEEGKLLQLQREDAMRQLQTHKTRIQIPVMPSRKKLVYVVALFAVMVGLAFVPAKTKEQAKELQQVREEAKEKEKEIEEVVEGLKELEQQEALTPEQLAALQEMLEGMQSSMKEYQQANSMEMLATANEKLEYKYGEMSSQLAELAASLESGATASVATAEAMQAMSKQLQAMSGTQALASNQGNNGQNGQSGNNQNSGQGGQSGQVGNNQGNQSGSQNGQNGNGQNGQAGQNGQGSGQGGQGGNGQGQGNGQGSGTGTSTGQGSGTGSGMGRGEGSSDALHDYVSIPNAIIDSGNLTGTAQNHDNSEFFRTQNGLSWEGTPVSYDAVIGQYEQNAYEGISAGQYPSGMEDVIKDYFASFN